MRVTVIQNSLWVKMFEVLREFGFYNKPDLKRQVEGMIYRARVGLPWRDLPEYFGNFKTVHSKFKTMCKKGVMKALMGLLEEQADTEFCALDSSSVKAHQHSAGSKKGEDEGIGISRGGKTTKIHAKTDAKGMPVDLMITGGNVHDSQVACEMIGRGPAFGEVLADKAYDDQKIRSAIRKRKFQNKKTKYSSNPVIPKRKYKNKNQDKKDNPDFNQTTYNKRHIVENFFANIKHCRGIATRFEKLESNYLGLCQLVCFYRWGSKIF